MANIFSYLCMNSVGEKAVLVGIFRYLKGYPGLKRKSPAALIHVPPKFLLNLTLTGSMTSI
jgi:hypothetical protein